MAGLLHAARSGAAGAQLWRSALAPAARALSTTGNPEVDALNRELDDFFGVQHTPSSSSVSPLHPASGVPPLRGAAAAPVPPVRWESTATSEASSIGPAAISHVASAVTVLNQQLAELRAQLQASAGPAVPQAPHLGGLQPGAASSSSYSSSSGQQASSQSSGGGGDGDGSGLTHVDSSGRAAMVDVSTKAATAREARASCRVLVGEQAFHLVQSNSLKKGDVLTVAQLAGITGAKLTSQLIPLCHALLLSKVDVALSLDAAAHAVVVRSRAVTVGQTGVEMEALTAAAVAALTVYDMVKAVTKDACITDLCLDFKSGGKSGTYHRGAVGGA